jgi:2-polyprenyl-3-methyl-5-hydroxy-6-metoxy-1,4-benzoquinol methylase
MCSARSPQRVGAKIRKYERDDKTWTQYECGECTLQYWSPRLIDSSFYAESHHDTYERRRRGESFLRERHHVFLRRGRPGRLLDIGCGEGAFLQVARDRGYDVSGVDLDPGNIATAQGRGLSNVACGLVVNAGGELIPMLRTAAPFDWVTAFEVLEHQADPAGFLRAVKSQLSSGGRMCGSVPNRDRVLANHNRKRSDGDFPPHHFLWFSPRALAATLRSAGFANVVVDPIHERDPLAFAAYLEHALLGSMTRKSKDSVRRVAQRSNSSPVRRLLKTAKMIKNAPFVPAALAIRWVRPSMSRALYFEAW